MGRLEDLRAKKWPNLSTDEKKEYSALLKKEERTSSQIEETKEVLGSKEEVVEVDRRTLSDLISRLEVLEKEKAGHLHKAGLYKTGEWTEKKEEKRIYEGTIRKYRESSDEGYKYALGLEFLQRRYNEILREDELIYKILLYDPTDPETKENRLVMTKPLLFFAKEFEKETVKLLERKVSVKEKVVGETNKVVVDYDKFSSSAGGRVPMTVAKEEIEFLIKLENGDKLWLRSEMLNL